MSEVRITRRMVVVGLVALPLVRVPDPALPEDDEPIWDCEIDDTWVLPGESPEVTVSALVRGSIGDTRYGADGFGSWIFRWPRRAQLDALGAVGLCEWVLADEWQDGRVGTVTVRLAATGQRELFYDDIA